MPERHIVNGFRKIVISAICISLLMLNPLQSRVFAANKDGSAIDDFEKYNNTDTVLAIEAGTIQENAARQALPEASLMYVQNAADGFLAVQTGKADAYISEKNIYENYISNNEKSGIIMVGDSTIGDSGYVAVGISPVTDIPDAEKLINDFISQQESDGILADMYDRWIVKRERVICCRTMLKLLKNTV